MSALGPNAASSSVQKMDYLTLLVTQMQNQNPLEPMTNDQMAAQLAQFSQLEQLEGMNTSFDQVLDSTNKSYAQSFVGKEVTFTDMTAFNPDTEQDGVTVRGFVEELDLKGGTSMLKIGVYDASGQRVDEHFVNFDKVETVGPDLASLF